MYLTTFNLTNYLKIGDQQAHTKYFSAGGPQYGLEFLSKQPVTNTGHTTEPRPVFSFLDDKAWKFEATSVAAQNH